MKKELAVTLTKDIDKDNDLGKDLVSRSHKVKYDPETKQVTHIKHIRTPGKHVSTTPSGHHIIHAKDGDEHSYYAYNPKTELMDMHVSGVNLHDNPKRTRLGSLELAGRKGSSIKAHEFYHHLIHHHGLELKASYHSHGGMKVWQKLHKMPGVNIYKHDGYKLTKARKIGPGITHLDWKDPNIKLPIDKKVAIERTKLIATNRNLKT